VALARNTPKIKIRAVAIQIATVLIIRALLSSINLKILSCPNDQKLSYMELWQGGPVCSSVKPRWF